MSTPNELADRLVAILPHIPPMCRIEVKFVATELRSLEAQPVNARMLDALHEVCMTMAHAPAGQLESKLNAMYEKCRAAIAAAESAPVPESAGTQMLEFIFANRHLSLSPRSPDGLYCVWDQSNGLRRVGDGKSPREAWGAAMESRSGAAQKAEEA